ncbi:MAG: phosphatase PAP2 family protein, partial [Bacteroidota bacterium]|nr:phosphatase PAP2 family protein [Bacteroidota bacterium]
MRAIIRSNLSFFLPYLVFLFIGALLLVISTKGDIHLGFNSFHYPILDKVLWAFTYLGDGVTALLVVIMLLAVNFRAAFLVAISNVVSATITQILKHTLFSEYVRPKKFFEDFQDIYFVPGVDNYLYHSFPSGHTTCAFALYLALALLVKKHSYKMFFFVMALTVSYSRTYLSQHFLMDVY